MNPNKQYDRILNLYRQNKSQQYVLENGIDELLLEIGVNEMDYHTQIKPDFLERGLVQQFDNGLALKIKGNTYSYMKDEIKRQKEFELHDEILRFAKASFKTGQPVIINELLLENIPDLPSTDVVHVVKAQAKNGYTFNYETMYRNWNVPNKTVNDMLQQYNLGVWVLAPGIEYLKNLDNPVAIPSYNITNTGNGIVAVNSSGITVNTSNDQMIELISKMIDFYQVERTTDLELLAAALEEYKNGNVPSTITFEKITSIAANFAKIGEFVMKLKGIS